MPQIYGAIAGDTSTIGSQINTHYYAKKALIEMKKEQFFSQLADVLSMPKHFGKTIKKFHYLPLLDDANINDQGIDADGLTSTVEVVIAVSMSDGSIPVIPPYYGKAVDNKVYFTGEGANAEAAEDDAIQNLEYWMEADTIGGGLGLTLADDAAMSAAMVSGGGAYDLGFRFTDLNGTTITDVTALSASTIPVGGNIYGSSKDIGTILSKLPSLSETGGRVNRVGFTRVEIEGTLEKFGFFDEYTQESLDFDTDAELETHIHREMLFGANELNEDALQIDLIQAAGVVRYPGTATDIDDMSGVAATLTAVDYADLAKLSIDLDNNRCPKHTKVITGTRMIDTKVVPSARVLYIGSELIPLIEKMEDYHENPAFIPVQHYAAATTILNGEIGSVSQFRVVVVPEMVHHAGEGIAEGVNSGYRVTDGAYDAYPMLVVGSESFTTIGFQTSGKSLKFKIFHKKPGEGIASLDDPYGEVGFMSIKWYYGFMPLRPERLAVLWTVAPW